MQKRRKHWDKPKWREGGFDMGTIAPIYTAENTKPAWQLDWSVTVFWRSAPFTDDWLEPLRSVLETDGIGILAHRFVNADRSQFLVSTLPTVKPIDVVQRVKGRLQFLVRDHWPKALRRNYDLHSIGSTQREKVENYVASQLEHHGLTGSVAAAQLADLQIINPDVDLSQPRFTSHARYRCNLHLVFVHADRHALSSTATLEAVRVMLRKASTVKGHLLSRLGLLPDHLHLVLGIAPEESPIEVALSYMNNIAFVYGMQPVLKASCYLGTIGEYDLGAITETAWLKD